MSKLTTILTIFVFCLLNVPLATYAEDSADPAIEAVVEKLLAQDSRPTIAEIKAAFPVWPKTNPFPGQSSDVTKRFAEYLVQAIVHFENMYPSAVYVGMGRDMQPLTDMLDAYYEARGEKGRSLRLNGSGATIRYSNMNDLADFMKLQGMSIESLSGPSYVLYDNSHYNTASQMFLLMAAGYLRAKEKGIPENEFVKKLGALNLNASNTTFGISTPAAAQEIQKILLESSENVPGGNSKVPMKIPNLRQVSVNGVMTYSHEWHGSFGNLSRDANGQIQVGQPDSRSSTYRAARSQILYDLFEVINTVSTSKFTELVNQYAQKNQYSYRGKYICRNVFH